jgi:hypothetical protein
MTSNSNQGIKQEPESLSSIVHMSSQQGIYSWRLSLPTWVISKAFEIQGKRAYGGWQWVFRMYDIRPRGDPVFEFAKDGDLDGLRQEFSCGNLSPFVRDRLGMTLLSVSSLSPYPFARDC